MSRVLLVHQPVDGGVGRHVADLATGLARRGVEVVLCGPQPPAAVVGGADGLTHVALDLQRSISPRRDLPALARFSSIVRRMRPDLIHAHSSKAGAIVRLARPAHPRVPVLYTPHGYAFNGYFQRELQRRSYRELERVLSLAADRVVCVCEAEARLARTVGPASRVRVVHNGIGPAPAGRTDPRIAAIASDGAVLCALSQLRPGKGLETLIDALREILAAHPRAQLAIAGEGPDGDALRERARRHGVERAVHFVGACEDPLELMRGAEVFVHPSWAEAFPYAVLEAMAVGLPIVASDVGGVGEALIDGSSGLLVAPRDSRALSGAIVGLLGDTERRRRLGEAARARVESEFTLQRMVDGIAGVYAEVAPALTGFAAALAAAGASGR